MKVRDILRLKSSTLYTVSPSESLMSALELMTDRDIGSLVVMQKGILVGMVTVRELTQVLVKSGGDIKQTSVHEAMDDKPLTCALETDMDEVRRMMVDSHVRYLPVMDGTTLMSVISFHDVARAVIDQENLENKMLKAYINDWVDPVDEQASKV